MSELKIEVSQVQGNETVSVFHAQGQLDGSTEKQLVEAAQKAHDSGTQYILLNLCDVDVVSSAGLRAIQQVFKMITPPQDVNQMRQPGEPYKSPYLKLVCPNPQIYYVLSITGFAQNILIYNNLDDAISSFKS